MPECCSQTCGWRPFTPPWLLLSWLILPDPPAADNFEASRLNFSQFLRSPYRVSSDKEMFPNCERHRDSSRRSCAQESATSDVGDDGDDGDVSGQEDCDEANVENNYRNPMEMWNLK